MLNFPKTFDDAGGIIAASVVQIILLVFVMVSLIALAYASDQCGDNGAENIQVYFCVYSTNFFFIISLKYAITGAEIKVLHPILGYYGRHDRSAWPIDNIFVYDVVLFWYNNNFTDSHWSSI